MNADQIGFHGERYQGIDLHFVYFCKLTLVITTFYAEYRIYQIHTLSLIDTSTQTRYFLLFVTNYFRVLKKCSLTDRTIIFHRLPSLVNKNKDLHILCEIY